MDKLKFSDRDTLVEDLLKMLERGSNNDVKIKLRDGEIVANKDILVARSEYFATMFSNNKFIEGETGSVYMSKFSKTVMERIIKFLFSGEVIFENMCLADLLELSYTSDMMILSELKAKVDDYIEDEIPKMGSNSFSHQRLILGLKLADQYKLTKIGERMTMKLHLLLGKIRNNISSSDSFKTLPFKLIKDIFLSPGVTNLPKALHKLIAFVVWLSKNEASEEQKNEIVQSINFQEFTVEELLTSVRESGLYSVKKIDERVLDLIKNKDLLLREKDLKIKELKRLGHKSKPIEKIPVIKLFIKKT